MNGIRADEWARIEPLLDSALELPTSERDAYLTRVCKGDAALRATLEQLLRDGEDPSGLLEQPLAMHVAPLLAESEAASRDGEQFGVWRVSGIAGRGGMGDVYRAERVEGDFAQTAALKVIRRGRENDPLVLRRFLDERRVLASLSHPNIAQLLDGGVTRDGTPWFAMEFVDGRPLDDYCDEQQLGVAERVALIERVLSAVAYAHRNLVVHRDLKPSNILVTAAGDIKLLDFGIAKLLEDDGTSRDEVATRIEARIMTPEYAAPEQVRGDAITTATDIYALGAVLYQLVTGERAHRFHKRTASEIERIVCDTDPTTPSVAARRAGADARKIGSVSNELDTIILKALQKDPARRYASADAMADDLRRLREGRPLLARPDTLGYRARKFVGRNRLAVSATVLVALAVVGGGAATWWQSRAARVQAVRAERVKTFLEDLLHQADPGITQGQEYSVRQLLDRGAVQVDTALVNEPVVQAELYEVLGNTYAHLGLAAKADTLHRKGLDVARKLYGPGSEEVLDQTMAVGWGLNDRGKYRETDSLMTRALREYRAAGGAQGQALADALSILATAKKREGATDTSEVLYREALALQIRLTGASDTITASRLSDLASLLSSLNRLAPAESALTAAQAHRRAVLPPIDRGYLVGESSLATILVKRGKLSDAVPRMETAIAGLEKIEQGGGLNLARALDKMAMLQWLLHRDSAAVTTSHRAVQMLHDQMGDEHPEYLAAQSSLALFESGTARADSALPRARAAYAQLAKVQGPRHDQTLAAAERLAHVAMLKGQTTEADTVVGTALQAVHARFGKVTPPYAALLATQARVLAARGKLFDEARVLSEARLALRNGTYVDSAMFLVSLPADAPERASKTVTRAPQH